MSVVKGSRTCSIDSKRRVTLPSKMRTALADHSEFVLTRGLECCLYLFPKETWHVMSAKLLALPQSDTDARFYLRMILQWSEDVSFDSQGRLLMPPKLAEYAELKQEALVIGVLDHIELWRPLRYREYVEKHGGYVAALEKTMSRAA